MTGAVTLREIADYLDVYLDVANVPDAEGAANGLQVENSGSVRKIVACTDACQATIDAAAERDADLMIVHHGLFWAGLRPLTGRNYARVRALLDADVAVYGAHIPLDIHPQVGNNAELARLLGLTECEPFGEYQGVYLGLHGELAIDRDALADRLSELLRRAPNVIGAGPEECRRVGVITGAASGYLREAKDLGLDTFITGEGPHHSYHDATEWGMNLIYAGHYATETLGVRALARHLAERFAVDWEFIDHPTGL